MTVTPGELWVADIPFTDARGSKKRPVLTLWIDGQDVVVAAVTSADPRSRTDVQISQWQQAGLRVPSTVRLSRLDCLEMNLMIAKLGTLSTGDRKTVLQTWRDSVQPAF